ncbi:fructose bisphosphate aldolase [Sphingopyxis sp. XHP0097]|uniref:fructose-bisphosphate aldolase n=1 Tax=Sphingopyxis jiangsuensis TaxID=2871171 RepID=A0ABS7MDL4_9SPHN|nr:MULTISPECIES: fructose bisphosphate aldolase [Sphingopyxis]MBY4636887.1 fructose bisphosphate aldolase [Sphingopyxis jiangsuensis]
MTTANAAMLEKIKSGQGFIAALDQSGGSTPKALKGYGIGEDAFSSDEEMFALIHAMRSRIVTSPCFDGAKVIGAILFERTMDGEAGGKPVPELLWERGVVPFLKVDKGLEAEADGVQLMKPNPDLDALCERALAKGIFGTKMRSVVNLANAAGIKAIVEQQFAEAKRIAAHGLVPIIEPEVNIKSAERDAADRLLLKEITAALESWDGAPVMLKLSIPAEANLFAPLVAHAKVLRVVALSGGFSRADACAELARNPGMIASFSRALLEDLRASMSDDEFDASLRGAIEEIHAASVA